LGQPIASGAVNEEGREAETRTLSWWCPSIRRYGRTRCAPKTEERLGWRRTRASVSEAQWTQSLEIAHKADCVAHTK